MTDPKPNLSRAAILSNIEYCQAKKDYHLTLANEFIKKAQDYIVMLAELKE
jgi:hypothetical protein